ncbi:tetratricopeptide repeat protein [Sediminibacillus sp. JSM 1682029]|uniref:tetratricopeptide repeat protein n=1 Tax=Sediminibacillus sp. JSM 1682029 TaxID=3229857 RepID=UPI003525F39E
MAIRAIKIRFIDENSNYEEEIHYKVSKEEKGDIKNGIIANNAELAQVCKNIEIGQIGTLKEGDRFLLVDKEEHYELDELAKDLDVVRRFPDEKLLLIGDNLPSIIANAISVPENTNELFNIIIDVKLTKYDIDGCIVLLEKLKDKLDVEGTINRLKKVKELQGNILINDVKNVFVLNQISQLYRDMEMYRTAKSVLKRSLEIDKNNPVTNTRLGSLSRLTGKYEEGIQYYNTALSVKEESYPFIGLGGLYREIKQLSKAEYSYLRALNLEHNDNHKHTHLGLGAVYFDMQRYEEGKKHYKLANVGTGYFYKRFYEAKDNYENEKAIEILNLILEIDINDSKAYWLLRQEGGI